MHFGTKTMTFIGKIMDFLYEKNFYTLLQDHRRSLYSYFIEIVIILDINLG